MRPIKVAIVGAGIAGLTAAYRLKERGYEVVVFEERIHVGGKLGAHPRRIALDPRPRGQGLVAKSRKQKYQDLLRKWIKELDKGGLPDDLRAVIERYIERQSLKFCKTRLDSGQILGGDTYVGPAYVDPESGSVQLITRLGRIQGWLVRIGDYSFNIWIYKNEWSKLRLEITDDVHHEHCYHMYVNWYRNFWRLMRDIGRDRSHAFAAFHDLGHLFPGTAPVGERLRLLTSIGSIDSIGDNLLSGVSSVPNLMLWYYSLADMVGESFQSDRYLDMSSVQGFLRSRWYATEQSVRLHDYILSKAFAIPTYLTSAYAYRSYVEYGVRHPQPMVWVLKTNSSEGLFDPLLDKLLKEEQGTKPCTIELGKRITGFELRADGRMSRLRYRPCDVFDAAESDEMVAVKTQQHSSNPDPENPDDDDGERMPDPRGGEQIYGFEPDYVILAVPPKALADIVSRFRRHLPSLNAVRKLQSGVTAALDLHFRKKIRGVPKRHLILRGSRYGLTVFDNSHVWKGNETDAKRTSLSVAATDFYKIAGMSKREAIQVMIEDLRRFIKFKYSEIDLAKSYLQMNDGEPMFLNEVGSEPWRPGPRTEIPNLFVAGDFCNNEVGIVSVEGAVVSGLLAARAVQAQAREDFKELDLDSSMLSPIPFLRPDKYPRMNAQALKSVLTPLAGAAKIQSRNEEMTKHPDRAVNPREWQAAVEDSLSMPGRVAADLLQLAAETTRWSGELPFRDE